jgi:hypothetical protein
MTLRDHARRLQRDLLPQDAADDLTERHRERVERDFAQAPLAQFVQRLRNYALHWRLPIPSGGLSYVRGGSFETRIILHPELRQLTIVAAEHAKAPQMGRKRRSNRPARQFS